MPLIPVSFKMDYDFGKPEEMVLLAPTGESHQRQQTWWRIKDLRPPEENSLTRKSREGDSYKIMRARWSAIEPAYNAWKSGSEVPTDGTALGQWAGVSGDQADHLKKMGIRTVEGIAELSPDHAARLPFPDARKLPTLAKAFLKSRGLATRDREIADLQAKLTAMEEMMASKPSAAPASEETEAA